MVKLIKYFLLTIKFFVKNCKTFYLKKIGKTFYKNTQWPSPPLFGDLVTGAITSMTCASGPTTGTTILIVKAVIPTISATVPMAGADIPAIGTNGNGNLVAKSKVLEVYA